jgi:predicted MFS family arabinose efflux permease
MMGGLTVAMVIGVPVGSWLGQMFIWRVPFFVVTVMGMIALLGLVWQLPRNIEQPAPSRFWSQIGLLANRRLTLMYLLTSMSFGGTFIVFTFLAPILTDITGVAESTVGIALLLFGGATVVGNFAGGRLTDAIGNRRSMTVLLVGLIVSFSLIPVAIHNATAILAVIAVWGMFAFAIPPVMQAGVVMVAEEVAPGAMGTGMNIAAFNLGISSGSFIGGRLLEGPGLMTTPYAVIVMAMLALILVVIAMREPVQAARVRVASH